MTVLADNDERFKGLLVKVSLFVLIAIIGVTLSLIFVSVKKGFFTPMSSIHFETGAGQDLKIGMPVKLSGFKIGTVTKLELDDKAQTQVEMLIQDRYLPLFKEDAVVTLKKEGIVGDSILEARLGSENKPNLKAGARIEFERGGGLEQISQDLRDRLYPALDEINHLLKRANDPNGDVLQILGNLRMLIDEIRGTREQISNLLGHMDETVTKDVRPMLNSVRQTIDGAANMTSKLNQELPGIMNNAGKSIDNVRQISETFKTTIDNSAPQISGFLGESRGLVSDTRNILSAASESWPLKNIIPPAEDELVKMDSHD